MENPFEKIKEVNYSEYLRELFKEKKTGDVFFINAGHKSIQNLRANINYIYKKKIATRVDKKDKKILWIKIL